MSLTAIANLYGTDKGTIGPSDSWRGHNYTDVYEAYLWPRRDEPVRLVEVGLGVKGDQYPAGIVHGRNAGGGASLKMWAHYFPLATLFGFDVNPASYLDSGRVTTFFADQGDPGSMRRAAEAAGGNFDFVVDDGSHRADHQQVTFGVLFEYLNPGGLYFIEDLMNNGHGEIEEGRFASSVPVLNTRQVFRTFTETGEFGVPNCIGHGDRIAADVDWIHLHCPEPYAPSTGAGEANERTVARFRPAGQEMSVIRKRALPVGDGVDRTIRS